LRLALVSSEIPADVRFALGTIIDEFEHVLYSGGPASEAQLEALRAKVDQAVRGW
jgi:hypothetical protein